MAAADKLAQREAKKRQLELPKKSRKKSLIVVLLYKKASNYSTKVVTVGITPVIRTAIAISTR